MKKKLGGEINLIVKSKKKKDLDRFLLELKDLSELKDFFIVSSFINLPKRKGSDLSYFKAPHANHKNSHLKMKVANHSLIIKVKEIKKNFFSTLVKLQKVWDLSIDFQVKNN